MLANFGIGTLARSSLGAWSIAMNVKDVMRLEIHSCPVPHHGAVAPGP
jgi:hypothetical protein